MVERNLGGKKFFFILISLNAAGFNLSESPITSVYIQIGRGSVVLHRWRNI